MALYKNSIESEIVDVPAEEALRNIAKILGEHHDRKATVIREIDAAIVRAILERCHQTPDDPRSPIYRKRKTNFDPDNKTLREKTRAYNACVEAAYRSGKFSEEDFARAIHDGFYNSAYPYPGKRPTQATMAGLCKAQEAHVEYIHWDRSVPIEDILADYRPF